MPARPAAPLNENATGNTSGNQTRLGPSLLQLARHPAATLLATWSWKTAAISAMLRALIFLCTNLRTGHAHAVHAMLVEATFAIVASGFLGAATQQLRNARPVWATALVLWLVLPALLFVAQYTLHRASGTQHMRAGLIASFFFASIASGFTWYAMQSGALLAGPESTSTAEDVHRLPRLILNFVLAAPRAVITRLRRETIPSDHFKK